MFGQYLFVVRGKVQKILRPQKTTSLIFFLNFDQMLVSN